VPCRLCSAAAARFRQLREFSCDTAQAEAASLSSAYTSTNATQRSSAGFASSTLKITLFALALALPPPCGQMEQPPHSLHVPFPAPPVPEGKWHCHHRDTLTVTLFTRALLLSVRADGTAATGTLLAVALPPAVFTCRLPVLPAAAPSAAQGAPRFRDGAPPPIMMPAPPRAMYGLADLPS
jgi:hypothetical protein